MSNESERDQPSEKAQKGYHTILEQHLSQAQDEIERKAGGLFLSGLSAGLDLGFGPFLMAVASTLTRDELSHAASRILVSLCYTVGFVFVIVGRSALFTEQTTSAVLPVLARRASFGQLLRLWGIVLGANLIGAALISAVIAHLGPRLGIAEPGAFGEVAGRLLNHSWGVMLISGIAAGWLMGLLSWLVIASRETISQVAVIVMTTFVIGIGGFHHSIAGTIEVLAAVFAHAGATLSDYGVFIVLSVIGNAIGGAVFVALLKFGHVNASHG